ncbi:MAG TPA: hypothetical protein VLE27_02300 [Thermoanaerobaculia bacterium]|nr:hypothetical protein [Thermoanaerobaculia bacterium]
MVLRKRRWLATAGLMAALSLAVPAPSTAAGLWRSAAELPGLSATAWSWLESLGVVRRMPEPSRRPVAVWEKQGVMIDPNGATTTTTTTTTTTVQVVWQVEGAGQPADGQK